ncbi:MAG TPA: hypothetical protein DD471_12430, partial [Planctomycetes bacterium]|nr:hypothetical protein [Planctomycetota bacterium]
MKLRSSLFSGSFLLRALRRLFTRLAGLALAGLRTFPSGLSFSGTLASLLFFSLVPFSLFALALLSLNRLPLTGLP